MAQNEIYTDNCMADQEDYLDGEDPQCREASVEVTDGWTSSECHYDETVDK
jgi:hypothetical protein